MQRTRIGIVHGLAVLLVVLSAGCSEGSGQVPIFEVDALWPMPLEYPDVLGPVSGVTVAPDGNILVVTRQDGFSSANEINVITESGDCCRPSMAVLEYAPDGSLVRQWGGPDMGYPWPSRPHGIGIDPEGNIWIGGGPAQAAGGGGGRGGRGGGGAAAGPAPAPQFDAFVLKFSRTGQHLATYGPDGGGAAMNSSMSSFAGANDFAFDGDVAYVADGYGNSRVAVVDVNTGQISEVWGAYGNAPSDDALPPYDPMGSRAQQFRSVTCVELADDGLLYVCDQGNDRIQVFDTSDGSYVNEVVIAPATLGNGSVVDIAFSPDQRFMYVADGMNERVYIVERETLTVLTSFGTGGRYPSHFRELGGVAVDEAGNVYTAENGQGRRVQKFVNIGMGPVTAEHQGAVYPASAQ